MSRNAEKRGKKKKRMQGRPHTSSATILTEGKTHGRLITLVLASIAQGVASLAVELLWTRELALWMGSSQKAISIVISSFMLGLAAGAIAGGVLADKQRDPIRLFSALTAVLALLIPAASFLLYEAAHLAGALNPTLKAITGFLMMLPATILMGTAFPLLAKTTIPEAERGRWLALLYSSNTGGGMAGVLLAGFVALPSGGFPAVAGLATLASLAASTLAWSASRPAERSREDSKEATTRQRKQRGQGRDAKSHAATNSSLLLPVVIAAMLGGFLCLADEVLWHRALMVVLPNSTYTATLLLLVFLGGLAAGGGIAELLVASKEKAAKTWIGAQIAASSILVLSLPILTLLPRIVRLVRPEQGWGRVLAAPLLLSGICLVPLTVVLGAAWPALLSYARSDYNRLGKRVGLLCMVNGVAASAGALAGSWLMLPGLGFGKAILTAAGGHALAASLLSRRWKTLAFASALLLAAGTALPRFGTVLLPSKVSSEGKAKLIFYKETASGTVSVFKETHGILSMYVNNSAVIGTSHEALKTVRALGILPVVMAPAPPQNALVIGLGAGVTTSMVASYPSVREVDVVELVPGVAEAARFFSKLNHGIASASSKATIVFDDGRSYLAGSSKSWDIVTCDPVHPLFGSGPLYTYEFFMEVRNHLKEGGVAAQYLPLHKMPTWAIKRVAYTFANVFPESWICFTSGHCVMLGSTSKLNTKWDIWKERLSLFKYKEDLRDSGLDTPYQLFSVLWLDSEGVKEIAKGPLVKDWKPDLEFLEPEAYRSGIFEENVKLLLEAYTGPGRLMEGISNAELERARVLVAAKKMLLFSILRARRGDRKEALSWALRALQLAPADVEIRKWIGQLR